MFYDGSKTVKVIQNYRLQSTKNIAHNIYDTHILNLSFSHLNKIIRCSFYVELEDPLHQLQIKMNPGM